ncbi:hypothetical protein MMC17_003101 [Xylographa soralifera]|nr:hypothetical protein [Xylographa soralifera]
MLEYPPMEPIVPVTAVCIALTVIGTIFTLYIVARPKDGHEIKQALSTYEDEDGKASPAAIAAFDDLPPRLVLVFSLLAALIASIGYLYAHYTWFNWTRWVSVATWLSVLMQTAALHTVKSPVLRFNIGFSVAFQSATIALYSLYNCYDDLWGELSIFPAAEGFFGLLSALAALSLPRRPEVERDGKAVDAQYTIAALSRYTMTWGKPLLNKALVAGGLEYSDLAQLDSSMIAANLHQRFRTAVAGNTEKRHLFYVIFKANQSLFIRLWGITLLESCANFLPQVCMFKILELLEKRDLGKGSVDKTVWLWVAGLCIAKMSYLELNGWVSWIRWCLIDVTVSKQLAAVIFDKSMRMEDIKLVKSAVETKDSRPSSRSATHRVPNNELTPLLPKSGSNIKSEPDVGKEIQQKSDDSADETSQNAINLLTVAIPKVTSFAKMNFMLLTGAIDTVLGTVFLIILIGVWSTFAGLLIVVLVQPFSKFLQQRYSAAQDAVMDAREKKTHVVTEALHGIKMIKISAIEDQWQRMIMDAREGEIRALRSSIIWGFALTLSWMCLPIIFSTVSLGVYAYLKGGLTASVAFTALAVFSSLEIALGGIPFSITLMIDALVGSKRIQDHLNNRDQVDYRFAEDGVKFENATISWPTDQEHSRETFVLRNINLEFPKASLSVIHGRTGCGKSLLLAAITGEANLISGRVVTSHSHQNFDHGNISNDRWIIPHSMAFVAQIPWIENETIKNNILYGLPFVRDRYNAVLYASTMNKDLEMLTDGEDTEVGASGINLSGGQKWRLTFARALYSRAGVLVLDDIFSAVDAHVGRHIFEHGLCGKLGAGRTRILVTHHIGLVLSEASYIVTIDRSGTVRGTSAVAYSDSGSGTLTPADHVKDEAMIEKAESEAIKQEDRVAAKFVEDEHREQGRISLKVYGAYVLASGGYIAWIFILMSFLLVSATTLGRSYWVEIWSNATDQTETNSSQNANFYSDLFDKSLIHDLRQDKTVFYLLVYLGISLLTVVLTGVKVGVTMVASLRASKVLFRHLTNSILRAKVRWLDTTPIGRILNRFVGDFEKVDDEISRSISYSSTYTFQLMGIVVASLFVSVWALIPAIVLLICCILIARIYMKGARDVKRLESSSKSPVLEHYTSSLLGLATIRSFGKKEEYVQQMYAMLDQEARTSWHGHLVVGWMEFRQGFLGIVFAVIVACSVVALPGIGAPLAGFALGFALEYAMVVVELIIQYAELELEMNAVERITEYIDMPVEDQDGDQVSATWPTQGRIEVQGLEVGYASNLPAVLKDVTFNVGSRKRVAIVGRTGSGKSSLTLAIFRMLEARRGSIKIDDIDISAITRHALRSRLAIIPQDPVLFSGTLRSNIDPFHKYSDQAVFDALRTMQLLDVEEAGAVTTGVEERHDANDASPKTINVFLNLDYQISRGGLNLSQGQRQLICLARALISRPKILVLDEATSSVDMATDAKIQRSIREDFAECTLLVIAHRLSTISDFDEVLVLAAGRVVEFGPPKQLWEGKGQFFEMISHSGEKDSIEDSFRG